MGQRKLDRFLGELDSGTAFDYFDFLNLLLETTNIGVGLCWRLFKLHDADHRVNIVSQDTDHSHALLD